MKKNKYIIITVMLSILNIQPISAACTQEEINNFKRIEDDYTIKYEYDKTSEKYNLYFTASKPKMYYYKLFVTEKPVCEKQDELTVKCTNFEAGTYEIWINGQTETCNERLKTIKIKLPKYNKLSEDPLCEGIEEFVLCSPMYEKAIDYETFVSRINTYKKTRENQEEVEASEENEDETESVNELLNFIKNNLVEIIIITIFFVLVIITIITTKRIRKSRYLE